MNIIKFCFKTVQQKKCMKIEEIFQFSTLEFFLNIFSAVFLALRIYSHICIRKNTQNNDNLLFICAPHTRTIEKSMNQRVCASREMFMLISRLFGIKIMREKKKENWNFSLMIMCCSQIKC